MQDEGINSSITLEGSSSLIVDYFRKINQQIHNLSKTNTCEKNIVLIGKKKKLNLILQFTTSLIHIQRLLVS